MAQRQPRQPTDMQGLMRFAIEAGTSSTTGLAGSGTSATSTTAQSLDPESRQWLQEALSSMSINVGQLMKSSLEKLKDSDDNGSDLNNQREAALDQILEWADNFDVAIDFHKMGGFPILIQCLKSSNSGVRWRAAELVGELTQNHDYFHQAETFNEDLIPTLLEMIDCDQEEIVRVKALYGVSCLLRQNELAQKKFVSSDGFSVLIRSMQSDIEKLKVKAAFLLSSLCGEKKNYKDILCDMGFVEQLISLIQREHESTHEHMIRALLSMVDKHERGISECCRSELNLQSTLQERISFLHGKEEFKEELEYCRELRKLCFEDTSNEEMCVR